MVSKKNKANTSDFRFKIDDSDDGKDDDFF